MIEWHYVKHIPIPKDGKLRTVAYHSELEGVEIVQERFCDKEISASLYEDVGYYAWTDYLLRPPAYPGEGEQSGECATAGEESLKQGG